jgi:uncharacterized hydrophobic protein (TIGR00271 family)
MKLFGLIPNDIERIDTYILRDEIHEKAHFSTSYAILLISSVIICTFGLLMDNAPVIIGGMIVAPLMWPLMNTACGIAYNSPKFLRSGLLMIAASLFLAYASSYLFTIISPIKNITEQILARTNPTFIDIIIALAGGLVASLGISQKKIADSIAGVAIATSLMPPLCASGIGAALGNATVTWQSFMLFAINAVAIIFVSVVTLALTGSLRENHIKLRGRGLVFLGLLLALLAYPTVLFLQDYTFRTKAFSQVQETIEAYFQINVPSVIVEDVSTSIDALQRGQPISISADILVPEDTILSEEQKQELLVNLQDKLSNPVKLDLRVQRTIALTSEEKQKDGALHDQLRQVLINELSLIDSTIRVDSFTAQNGENDGVINISVITRADPSIKFTESERKVIENRLSQLANREVRLSLEIISRIALQSEPDREEQLLIQRTQEFFQAQPFDNEIDKINVTKNNEVYSVKVDLSIDILAEFDSELPSRLYNWLTAQNGEIDEVQIQLQRRETISANPRTNLPSDLEDESVNQIQ